MYEHIYMYILYILLLLIIISLLKIKYDVEVFDFSIRLIISKIPRAILKTTNEYTVFPVF